MEVTLETSARPGRVDCQTEGGAQGQPERTFDSHRPQIDVHAGEHDVSDDDDTSDRGCRGEAGGG